MDREIKFRAWLENVERPGSNEGMIFGYCKESYKKFLQKCIEFAPEREKEFMNSKGIATLSGTVYRMHDFFNNGWLGRMHKMEWTGLKDKNKIDIFEGDIRKFKTGIGTIIWSDAAFAVKSPGSEAIDWEHSSVLIDSEYLGNIYQNPEILNH